MFFIHWFVGVQSCLFSGVDSVGSVDPILFIHWSVMKYREGSSSYSLFSAVMVRRLGPVLFINWSVTALNVGIVPFRFSMLERELSP